MTIQCVDNITQDYIINIYTYTHNHMEVPPLAVLGFVNDYKIKKNLLRIKSFYQYHSCQLEQYKDITKSIDSIKIQQCEDSNPIPLYLI